MRGNRGFPRGGGMRGAGGRGGGGFGGSGGGHRGRGGGSNRGNRANLPYNREGKAEPYMKDPRDRRPEPSNKRFKSRQLLSADNFTSEKLNDLANKYWAPNTVKEHKVSFESFKVRKQIANYF